MIVTIRSNNGFYRSVEYEEFESDWRNYFKFLKNRVDFQFCKNWNKYSRKGVFRDTFAPSLKVLREKVETY